MDRNKKVGIVRGRGGVGQRGESNRGKAGAIVIEQLQKLFKYMFLDGTFPIFPREENGDRCT